MEIRRRRGVAYERVLMPKRLGFMRLARLSLRILGLDHLWASNSELPARRPDGDAGIRSLL